MSLFRRQPDRRLTAGLRGVPDDILFNEDGEDGQPLPAGVEDFRRRLDDVTADDFRDRP